MARRATMEGTVTAPVREIDGTPWVLVTDDHGNSYEATMTPRPFIPRNSSALRSLKVGDRVHVGPGIEEPAPSLLFVRRIERVES